MAVLLAYFHQVESPHWVDYLGPKWITNPTLYQHSYRVYITQVLYLIQLALANNAAKNTMKDGFGRNQKGRVFLEKWMVKLV